MQKLLGDTAQECFVLQHQVMRRVQGEWQTFTQPMFPGYVFLVTRNLEAAKRQLALSSAFACLVAPQGAVMQLQPEEIDFICAFGGKNHVVKVSEGVIENGRTVVRRGPLRGRTNLISKIDRHKRVAWLNLGLLGQGKVRVGLEITRKS